MRRSSRTAVLVLLGACVSSLSGCSSSKETVIRCQTGAECPSGSRCVSQTCVANAPPVADFAVPAGAVEATALVTLDARASYDPDAPSDSIASYAWSVASVDAACAPPEIASTASIANVRFACAGTYEVTLVATDEMSGASAPSTRRVVVVPYSGVPLAVVGADLARAHSCSGAPLLCTLTGGAVPLSASATADAPGGLSWHWSAEPPADRPIDSTRRVKFSPSADVPAPAATIETDGTAISGDWIFRVEARDEAGVVAALATRVSVGNSAPVVSATVPASFPHAFSAVPSQLTSAGTIPLAVSDPDGDPLVGRTVEWRHAGDGGALFGGQDLGTSVTFNVIVPYAQLPDALLLRGGPGLARSIEFSIADVNGKVTQRSLPVVIGNREPRVAYASNVSVNHSFDAAAMEYGADASVGTWVDDDGDPAVQWGPTGDVQCATAEATAGQAVVHCAMPYPGNPAAQQFTGTHLVDVALGDPWSGAATPAIGVVLAVGNRNPAVLAKTVNVPVSCSTSTTCCRRDIEQMCIAWYVNYGGGSASGTPNVSDPDGDPLIVQAGGDPAYPAASAADLLPVTASTAAATVCSASPPSASVSVVVSDGSGSATGELTFRASCL